MEGSLSRIGAAAYCTGALFVWLVVAGGMAGSCKAEVGGGYESCLAYVGLYLLFGGLRFGR